MMMITIMVIKYSGDSPKVGSYSCKKRPVTYRTTSAVKIAINVNHTNP